MAGQLIYAVGDVHGRYDLLRRLLAAIAEDAGAHAGRPTLILLGDYVDRGPASAEVLTALCWLRRESGARLHLLKGNHEALMLDALNDPATMPRWLAVGGDATLKAYGIDADDGEPEALRDRLLDAMPASHLRLLQSLELSVEIGDYFFVHAGIRPGTPIARQKAEDLIWIRDPFLTGSGALEKRIVHGHSWTSDKPHIDERRIGVDTGAWKTGVLTAVRLHERSERILTARQEP
ncbi:serine/threonine protein phosphatase 1 [Sphingomonas jejuensis]|uniref:Serine/threonine protein phosphatase 1 n=1 Tax=Sphingomonas jejuensis TaxID=904715 RepID=A0ABX0XHY7_9SPHN|nr:metallophosphoesterase family protein [Sphingomonas jejuensis]NJC32952.1 serine/threonine protein phosphatase 1 [Sphingomonas jejuensis]